MIDSKSGYRGVCMSVIALRFPILLLITKKFSLLVGGFAWSPNRC